MDLFKRRRGEWVKKVKAFGLEFIASLPSSLPVVQPEEDAGVTGNGSDEVKGKKSKKDKKNKGPKGKKGEAPPDPTKSAIQLAREKFAAAKLAGGRVTKDGHGQGKGFKGTGANAGVVVGGEK